MALQSAHIVIPDTLREGLLSGLEGHSRVFLSAGPGWGKTAAVRRLLERGECTFLSLGRRAPSPNLSRKRLVVLDNLQRLTPLEERELADQLLRAPRGQRFILLSRGPLPVCLSPLASAGEVLVLGQELLALDGGAVAVLASDAGLDLSRETLAAVEKATGGHPVAVRMLLEKLAAGQPLEQAVDSAGQGVGAYLEELCRRELGERAAALLMKLSFFPTFDGELAAMLSGEKSAGESLERVARVTGLLRQQGRDWAFSAQPWFSAYLQRKARALLPLEELRQVFRTGGRWYENRGDGFHGAECWRQAGDRGRLMDLLIQTSRHPQDAGMWYEMAEIFRSLTEEEMRASPDLMCAQAMLCSVTGDPAGAEAWYRKLKGQGGDRPDRLRGLTAYLELALPHRPVGPPQQVSTAARVLENGEGPDLPECSLSQGLPSLLRGSRDFSAWAGQDERDLQTACKAMEGVLGRSGVGFGDLLSMELLLEQGRDVSHRLLEMDGLQRKLRAQGTREMEFVLTALLARTLYAAGHRNRAVEVLLTFRLGLEERYKTIRSNLDALRCRLSLMQGDNYAKVWFQEQAPKEEPFLPLEHYRYLTLVRCYLKWEDYCSALLLLGRLLPFTQEYHRPLDRVEALLLAAVCRFRMGGGDWQDLFRQALALGERYGYVAVFAREGTALLPLAEGLEHRPVSQAYWQQILGAVIEMAGCYPNYLCPAVQLSQPLTGTEKLVLRLLCQNKSTAEICALLEIKGPTAKTHIQHIYRKLGVHNKAGVLKAAKDLKLLKG